MPGSPCSFAQALRGDEEERFPEGAAAALDRWGLPAWYVPLTAGGRLDSFEEAHALLRVVGRRDLTLAIGHAGTFLGSVTTWLAGTPEQRARLAAFVKGGGVVAFALSEREHGSDLLACETRATAEGQGFRLQGGKWPIGNARRARALTVFARTAAEGGPRGFSLFLGYREGQAGPVATRTPTLGIRGADVGGLEIEGWSLPAAARVGAAGQGLEWALKGLQVTRTLVPAAALGAADTALRLVLRFAQQRRLQGRAVLDLPLVQRTLCGAFADLLAAECLALAAARILHAAPAQAALWSAVAKYLVPTQVEAVLRDLAVVLGARHYLRQEGEWGFFQKIQRDAGVVSLFDGSTVVNLQAIALQLRGLGRAPEASRVAAAFALAAPLPSFAGEALGLASGGDASAAALRRHGDEMRSGGLVGPAALADEVAAALRADDQAVDALWKEQGVAMASSSLAFDLAERRCRLLAAGACLRLWWQSRPALSAFGAGGAWLPLAVNRLLLRAPAAADEAVLAELLRLQREHLLFSLVPFPLAGAA